jgi:hypothetical protein
MMRRIHNGQSPCARAYHEKTGDASVSRFMRKSLKMARQTIFYFANRAYSKTSCGRISCSTENSILADVPVVNSFRRFIFGILLSQTPKRIVAMRQCLKIDTLAANFELIVFG